MRTTPAPHPTTAPPAPAPSRPGPAPGHRSAERLARRPVATLIVATVVTLVLGLAAGEQRTEAGLDAFTPGGPAADAWDRVRDQFDATGATLVVLLQAPTGGTVDDPAALEVTDAVKAAAAGLDGVVTTGIVDHRDDPAAGLRSGPGDVGDGGEVGLVVVPLDAELTLDRQADAARALAERLAEIDAGGHRLAVVGDALISAEIDENAAAELGRLALVALAVVIVLLAALYRRISDVVIGLVGIVVSLVWAVGLTVVVGPDGLGITGHQSAISVIVPVLIIGLGIDFGIHLTTRQREAASDGDPPRRAAAVAIGAVGAALVLAAVTTMLGFLTNLASPLAPVRDLGVHTALGVAASLVASLLVVPALRQLLDRRTATRTARPVGAPSPAGTDPATTTDALGRALVALGRIPLRRPRATLAVAAAWAAIGAVGAAGLGTSFDERDFLPDGRPLTDAVRLMETAFGGDPGETSYLLIDGDLTDPAVVTALAEVHDRLAEVDGVVTAGGTARALSPAVLLAEAGVVPTDAATVAAAYDALRAADPATVGSVLAPDHRSAVLAVATSGTPAGAAELAERLTEAATPLLDLGVEVTATSQDVVTASVHDALADSQLVGLALTLGVTAVLLVVVHLRDRRVVPGLASLLPAALAAVWTGGIMAVAGYELNVLTIMISALAVGIGVPFGIHVTARYHRELDAGVEPRQALERTVARTGRAVVGSALTTAAGFGALALSANEAIRQFGTITFVCVVAAAVAALVVQPAALALWGERVGRHRPDGARSPEVGGAVPGADDDRPELVGAAPGGRP